MIAYFVLGVGLLLGFGLLVKWFTEADPRRAGRALLWAVGLVCGVFGLLLLWLGRYQLAWIGLPALYALASRWRQIASLLRTVNRQRGGGRDGQGGGRSSTVDTRFLRMTLRHDTGVMTGEIREGQFAGRRLDDLSLQDCVLLWEEVSAADEESSAVLESYLDRVYGDTWREAVAAAGGPAGAGAGGGAGGERATGGGGGPMSRDEARAILGVDASASADTIRAAYRRLMQRVHPDVGGSDYFAMKLNEARRVLLGE